MQQPYARNLGHCMFTEICTGIYYKFSVRPVALFAAAVYGAINVRNIKRRTHAFLNLLSSFFMNVLSPIFI
jgi:hypothetical protein